MFREVLRIWRASGAETDAASAKPSSEDLPPGVATSTRHARLLESARADLLRGGNHGEVLTTDVKIADMLVLAGETAQAIPAIDAAFVLASGTDGGSLVTPALNRLRGLALVEMGQVRRRRGIAQPCGSGQRASATIATRPPSPSTP